MQWDVFCRVVDNFGDIGVCWRLAVDLGQRGEQVRLWVDDASALQWMAPQVSWARVAAGLSSWLVGTGQSGVTVHDWQQAEQGGEALPEPGQVVIEAFGCNPPDAFVAKMNRPLPPKWINLEYLSAEDYVERSHRLRSPVWSGVGKGLDKWFFYPGFTSATGGLLREPSLLARRDEQLAQAGWRAAALASLGAPGVTADEQVVSLFCYDAAPVDALLDLLVREGQPTRVLLTPGPAARLATDWLRSKGDLGQGCALGPVTLSPLPALPQAAFDTLLWCSDLNLVRGEDSAVRALWAGKPHIWHLYPQEDGAHAAKLDAFMARWMADWDPALRTSVQALWRGWNGLGPMPRTLPDWRSQRTAWAQANEKSGRKLALQRDLMTQLGEFVASSG